MDQSTTNEEAARDLTSSLNSEQLQKLLDLHKRGHLAELLDLIKKKPLFFRNLVHDQLHEEPVLDYVTDLEARFDIYCRICDIRRRSKSTSKLNMALFAIFMVAPIDLLQSRLERLRESLRNNDLATVQQFFSDCQTIVLTAILEYAKKGGSQSLLPTPQLPDLTVSFSTSAPSAIAAKICKQRDNDQCLFTGLVDPEAAHIFPFIAAENTNPSNLLLATLRMFWGNDTADQLAALIQDQHITESPQNLLSLNRQLHWWFDNAKMALKPLRKNGESVIVQLHWLRPSQWKPTDNGDINDPHIAMAVNAADLGSQQWGNILAHRMSGLFLETGQTFTLTADDPNHVPNFELLKLSWDLLRVIAICGAAAEPTEEDDDDDDYDNYNDDGDDYNDYDDDGDYDDNELPGMWDENVHAQLHQWATEVETEEEEGR